MTIWNIINPYLRWQAEAAQITKDLGLVYTEKNPPPNGSPSGIGDPLPAANNAITHAYMSAMIASHYSYDIAKWFGDHRELTQPPGRGFDWDTYKDLWNNEVGRRIGSDIGPDDEKIKQSLKDSWKSGDLIRTHEDSRVRTQ